MTPVNTHGRPMMKSRRRIHWESQEETLLLMRAVAKHRVKKIMTAMGLPRKEFSTLGAGVKPLKASMSTPRKQGQSVSTKVQR